MPKITQESEIDNDTFVFDFHDAVFFQVYCYDIGLIKWLAKKFTYRIENWLYHPKVRAGVWDGKTSLIDVENQRIPIALFKPVIEAINSAGYKYLIAFDKKFLYDFELEEKEVSAFTKKIMSNAPFDWEEREYQMRCIFSALKNKRGVLEASVGSGKSFMLYAIIRFLLHKNKDFKIILAVPTVMLVQQMVQDWADYGWDDVEDVVEILHGGSKPTFKTPVLVTTWQSVYKRKNTFFEDFDGMIFDEAHTASSESLLGIAKKCSNALYRIGTTGTMPEEKICEMNIKAFIGPILEKVDTVELQEEDVLTQLRVMLVNFIYDKSYYPLTKTFNYQDEVNFLSTHEERFTQIVSTHRRYIKKHENTLVLAQKIDQIKMLESKFKLAYGDSRSIMVITGEVSDRRREQIRKMVNDMEGVIIIATYQTMSTGVNIPKLHHIMFASSYKSKIKIVQSLGRVLRKHASKVVSYLWDFTDDLRCGYVTKNHSLKHRDKRISIYKNMNFPMKSIDIPIGKIEKTSLIKKRNSVWVS